MRTLKGLARLCYRLVSPLSNFLRLPWLPRYYAAYLIDAYRYSRQPHAEKISLLDLFPCIYDNTGSNPFDSHYFYQDIWAFKEVIKSAPAWHVDVGSTAIFVGMVSAVVDVTFVDIRPLRVDLDRYSYKAGSILEMPFANDSVESLSCLHVAEHIGLGRYGDPLDAEGTQKAARELARVLAPGGRLLFSVPIGRPRIEFNAHRIHSATQILDYFGSLKLVDFSGVDDRGIFKKRRDIGELDNCEYGCGFFIFSKPQLKVSL